MKQPTVYDTTWGIPNAFKLPPAFNRPTTASNNRDLEHGFFAGYNKHKSYNSNATMSKEEEYLISCLIQQYRWVTRNTETDMSLPFDPRLLYDRKFTNQA